MIGTDSTYLERQEGSLSDAGELTSFRPSPIGSLGWLVGEQENSEYLSDEPVLASHIERYMVDVLGATVERDRFETFAYRRRGEDTLTWGEPDEWMVVQWFRLLSQLGTGFPSRLEGRLWKSYTAFREALIRTRIFAIGQIFELRDTKSVRNFLCKNPSLLSFLDESYFYLRKHFGIEARFILEIVKYPDDLSVESLVVFIATSLSVDEALTKLDALDYDWYLEQADRVGELVNFNIELQ